MSDASETTSHSSSVEDHLLEHLIQEQPELVAKRLQVCLDGPQAGQRMAEEIVACLDRLGNDYLVREVIERGLTLEDECARFVFADRIGKLAARNSQDAYALLRKLCLDDGSKMPDLVRVGLQAIQRDAEPETFEFIVGKGLKEQHAEIKPGAIEHQRQVNRRFRKALEAIAEHAD